MSSEIKTGIIAGVIIGIIIVLFILKYTKTNRKLKCEYDERQELVRGRGFKYGFFTMLIVAACTEAWSAFIENAIINHFTSTMLTCFSGITVYAIYCIWNDAYFALNEKRKSLIIVFAFVGIYNLILGCVNIFQHLTQNTGLITANMICAVMFIAIFIALLLKSRKDQKDESEN